MQLEEDLVKVYFKLTKIPHETSYCVIHLYSVPQYGNTSFTLKNCTVILKNITDLDKVYTDMLVLTINHLYVHIYQSSDEKCIGFYETRDILGARNLGKRLDGKSDIFVIKTLSSQNFHCPTFHFFKLSSRDDQCYVDKICKSINRNVEKAKSTVITRISNISAYHVFVDKKRFEQESEKLSYCLAQIDDAMKILNTSIRYRKILENKYKDCSFKGLKQKFIMRKAAGLSHQEIKNIIEKIRHAFNIISVLKLFLYKPNSVDLIHHLFPYLITFVYLYGIENSAEIKNPYFTESTLKMLCFCVTTAEFEFLSKLGDEWCKSNYGEANVQLVDDCYLASFFETEIGFVEDSVPFNLPEEENDRKLLSFNDYRIVRCNYKKKDQTELSVKAGEIVIVVLVNELNCFAKNVRNEYGYVSLTLLTSPIELNFNADILMNSLYLRMKKQASSQEKSTQIYDIDKSLHISYDNLVNGSSKCKPQQKISVSEI